MIESEENNQLFTIIANQTGINDMEIIKEKYKQNDNDVTKTIYSLLNIDLPNLRLKKPRNIFDEIRDIFDEKDNLYQEIKKREGN